MKIRGNTVGTNMKPEKIADRFPIATHDTLGGVMPYIKTDDMTQAVGVDSDGRLWTILNPVKPIPETDDMTVPVGMDKEGKLWTYPCEGGGGEPYVLPIATHDTLGGVRPKPKTDDMNLDVGVDSNGMLWTTSCKVNPMPKTDDMTQAVGVDKYGSLWTAPSEGGGGEPYVLPVATPDILGGVKTAPRDEEMTQVVGIDENGGLWTYPCEGGGSGGAETKTKFITVADITFDNDTVIGGDNDDISFGDAVVMGRHFFYKTPEGEQLKAKRIWGYLQPSAAFNGTGFNMSAYYADGTPKRWNFGDLYGPNIGILCFTNNNNVNANQYWEFALSADLKICQWFVVNQRSWTSSSTAYCGIPYISLDTEIPYISGFKISSTSSHTIPAGSRFILRAEVEDNA